jgi:hypothetical protein
MRHSVTHPAPAVGFSPLYWPAPASPVGEEGAGMPYYIFHYTRAARSNSAVSQPFWRTSLPDVLTRCRYRYGIEYSLEGLPMELQARIA